MSATFYKALGYAVWKGGIWYVRRHSPGASRRLAGGVLAAAAVGAGIVVALRRNSHSG
ncbi:MAG TPA: hypothetical protein VE972_09440 [Conexibacter sp.]|nr:hypothetical protein [Conexibacter sp.]